MVFVLSVAGRARAEEPADAKALFKDALLQYNVGEYAKALEKFKAAYLMRPDAAFLFNIGQCQRQLGQYDAAAKSYRAFLRESQNLPQKTRDDVQRLVGEMDDAAREQRAKAPPTGMQPPQEGGLTPKPLPPEVPPTAPPQQPQVVAPPPPAPARPWYKNPAGMALAGGGIVLAAVGAGLLGVANSDESSARNAMTLQNQQSLHNDAKGFQSGGIALLVVGGAATVAGVVVLAVGARHRPTVEARR
jgi:tetratricopeptide (TPR) repeat protein